jgi:hypothetical protein
MKQQIYEQMLEDIRGVVLKSLSSERALSGILSIHKILGEGKQPFCESWRKASLEREAANKGY